MISGRYSSIDGKILVEKKNEKVFFEEDSITYEDDKVKILTEGLILNNRQICKESNFNSLVDAIICAYNNNTLFRLFKGSFLIVVYDKGKNELLVLNDLLSKKSVYYYLNERKLYFSTSYFDLIETLKSNSIPLTIDNIGITMMKKTGRFYDDYTYVKEVKYLKPYQYINNSQLFELDKKKYLISSDKMIDEMDELFKEAIKLQYTKNVDNGKKQITTLSGGMDSKNVLIQAYNLGFKNDLAFTYAEKNSLDEIIAKKIAKDYNIDIKYYNLQSGNFMLDYREEICKRMECQMLYSGTTGLIYALKDIDLSKAGIVHTGSAGGEILGDICSNESSEVAYEKFIKNFGMSNEESNIFLEKIGYKNNDFNCFVRINVIRECLAFQKNSLGFFEAYSPYLDEDFFEYILSIDVSYLRKEKKYRILYGKWVDSKAKNRYRTTNLSINHNNSILKYPRFIIKKVRNTLGMKSKYEMNPLWYWGKKNSILMEKLINIYIDEKDRIEKLGINIWEESIEQNLSNVSNLLTCSYAILKIFGEDKNENSNNCRG